MNIKKLTFVGLTAALALLLFMPAGSIFAAGPGQEMISRDRASQLIGLPVTNDQGVELGRVNDIVVSKNANVPYLIISRGGATGIGEKLIPIPYDSSFVSTTPSGVVLKDIDKAKLDNAPSLSRSRIVYNNQWQALDNQSFENKVHSYYGNAGGSGAGSTSAAESNQEMISMNRANELVGLPVMNAQGVELGEVNDVIVGKNGNAPYLIISSRGATGMGERLVPVPYDSSFVRTTPNGVVLKNMDQAKFDKAPSISNSRIIYSNQWQALDDRGFENKVNSYYGVSGSAAMSKPGGMEARETSARGTGMIDMARADTLIGAPVENEQGQKLGEVRDVIIGANDNVDYLIVSQVPGAEGKLIPVPFRTAYVNTQRDGIVLRGIDEAKLDNAPYFRDGEWQRLDEQSFNNNVRGYYGYAAASPAPAPKAGRNPNDLPPAGLVGPTPGSSGNTVEQTRTPGNW